MRRFRIRNYNSQRSATNGQEPGKVHTIQTCRQVDGDDGENHQARAGEIRRCGQVWNDGQGRSVQARGDRCQGGRAEDGNQGSRQACDQACCRQDRGR